LFEFYLLGDGSLAGCAGISDATVAVAAQENRLAEALARKKESDFYSGLLEHVADALATRHPDAANLPAEWAGLYDHGPNRKNYLLLQEIIAGLRLRERAMLGQAFDEASRAVAGKGQGFTYRAAHFDARPEWVFVVGASRNIDRLDLLRRMDVLMSSAMTAYGKTRCFIVVDRDSDGYEVGLSRPDFQPTLTDYERAEHFFSRLKVTSGPLGLVP
jgi:hypothetical protein